MSGKRYAAKRDGNEQSIVQALRDIGASVMQVDKVDLIVGYRGENYLLEVKDPKGRNRLTPSQERLIVEWRGQYAVIRNIDEALQTIGAID